MGISIPKGSYNWGEGAGGTIHWGCNRGKGVGGLQQGRGGLYIWREGRGATQGVEEAIHGGPIVKMCLYIYVFATFILIFFFKLQIWA